MYLIDIIYSVVFLCSQVSSKDDVTQDDRYVKYYDGLCEQNTQLKKQLFQKDIGMVRAQLVSIQINPLSPRHDHSHF